MDTRPAEYQSPSYEYSQPLAVCKELPTEMPCGSSLVAGHAVALRLRCGGRTKCSVGETPERRRLPSRYQITGRGPPGRSYEQKHSPPPHGSLPHKNMCQTQITVGESNKAVLGTLWMYSRQRKRLQATCSSRH